MDEVIEYCGNFYKIKQQKFEPREIFMERVWFILKNINTQSFTDLVLESYIWINKKYLKCKYLSLDS